MFWVKYSDQVDEIWDEELVIIRHLDKYCSVESREKRPREGLGRLKGDTGTYTGTMVLMDAVEESVSVEVSVSPVESSGNAGKGGNLAILLLRNS